MEVSVIRSSQSKASPTELARRELGFCGSEARGVRALRTRTELCFARRRNWRNARLRFSSPTAVASEPVRPRGASESSESSESCNHVKLFVGLPLDVISICNTVNHARAIAAGLKVLKLLGVDGVEVPVWWGIVENEAPGKYEWSGYLALAEMVQKAGLKLHASLCFHGLKQASIALPEWVSRAGESEPGIYFTDRSGRQYKECLSLGVDDVPVLDGKTPIQVYREFCESFRSSFLSVVGPMMEGVTVGLGPDGELRYPSHHHHNSAGDSRVPGAGEFQCYDKFMLGSLKQHAEAAGNPLWGLGGPHDAPGHDHPPCSAGFFRDLGGSWETPYGDFFLSWYSAQLAGHADRVLSAASSALGGPSAVPEISARVPLVHLWYGTRSHPSELAAGFYNTCHRDGYDTVAAVLAARSCAVALPGMDLSDRDGPAEALSHPELLLRQIATACRKHGVRVSGQNLAFSDSWGGFGRIADNLLGEGLAGSFTYQRMGVEFFSPEHFSPFARFVKVLNQPELYHDPEGSEDVESVHGFTIKDQNASSLVKT